jgi:enterochelin esterase-like enzyme
MPVKDVPHGLVSENIYFSKLTNSFRRCFVYTPLNTARITQKRYPVLYLQHGSFEDETGWASQGKAGLILDNLIAAGKAVPMIIVMDNGYAYKPQTGENTGRPASIFEEVMINEIIPMTRCKIPHHCRPRTPRHCRTFDGSQPNHAHHHEQPRQVCFMAVSVVHRITQVLQRD